MRINITEKNDIHIDTSDLSELIAKIPVEDFIDIQFDYDYDVSTNDVLIIFSTPRSGSTLLSDLINKNNICLTHEYFQPYQYLPILASRWGCIRDGKLDKAAFLGNLFRYRTYPGGWLGVNLHGEHLKIFSKFEKGFADVRKHFIHIIRRDLISQAVSYEIAIQTGKWSSYFDSQADANYNFTGIKTRLESIQSQNAIISAFIKSRNISCTILYYEDLVENPKDTIQSIIPDVKTDSLLLMESGLKRQASSRSKEWIERFSLEYFETNGDGYNNENAFKNKQSLKERFKSIFNAR